MTAKILKGTLVRIKSQFCESHVSAWYRLSEDERDECRAARRERLDAAEAAGEDTFSIAFDCAGEPRLAPRDGYVDLYKDTEYRVVRARVQADCGYHTVSGCAIIHDEKTGRDVFVRRHLIEVVPAPVEQNEVYVRAADFSNLHAELIMLDWGTCSACGRPSAGDQSSCTAVCHMVGDKIDAGMSPEAAVRAHLNPKYDLPAFPEPVVAANIAALEAELKAAKERLEAAKQAVLDLPSSDQYGNSQATMGMHCCECGCKYWEFDRCIDCGTVFHADNLASDDWANEAPEPEPVRDTKADVNAFAERVQGIVNTYWSRNGYDAHGRTPDAVSVMFGRKYARLVLSSTNGGTSRSVHCFVDMTNGDVLKSASWKAPAKHARGNIYNSDQGMGCVNQYGAAYLR